MKFHNRIALKYIFSRHSFHFIRIITIFSIIGTSIGVAALIAVMSVFNGFLDITEQQILGFDPHLKVTHNSISNEEITSFENIAEIQSFSEYYQVRTIATNENNIQVFNIKMLNENREEYIKSIENIVRFGHFDKSNSKTPGITLGAGIADKLRVLPGDTIKILTPDMIEKSIRTFQLSGGINCVVSGIFQTNIPQNDLNFAFANMNLYNNLKKYIGSKEKFIEIKVNDINKVEETKENISSKFNDPDIKIETWKELNQNLFSILEFERLAAFLVLSIIILIAVFNTFISLALTVVEKKSDIGLLKALGTENNTIRNIYISEGIIIGVIGSLLGAVLGLALCYIQIEYGIFGVDPNKYVVDRIPMIIHYSDVVIVVITAMILSSLATIYPAKRAAKVSIVEAVKQGE